MKNALGFALLAVLLTWAPAPAFTFLRIVCITGAIANIGEAVTVWLARNKKPRTASQLRQSVAVRDMIR